jgi:fructose-specific component phosphotransferase system IIB-like protein
MPEEIDLSAFDAHVKSKSTKTTDIDLSAFDAHVKKKEEPLVVEPSITSEPLDLEAPYIDLSKGLKSDINNGIYNIYTSVTGYTMNLFGMTSDHQEEEVIKASKIKVANNGGDLRLKTFTDETIAKIVTPNIVQYEGYSENENYFWDAASTETSFNYGSKILSPEEFSKKPLTPNYDKVHKYFDDLLDKHETWVKNLNRDEENIPMLPEEIEQVRAITLKKIKDRQTSESFQLFLDEEEVEAPTGIVDYNKKYNEYYLSRKDLFETAYKDFAGPIAKDLQLKINNNQITYDDAIKLQETKSQEFVDNYNENTKLELSKFEMNNNLQNQEIVNYEALLDSKWITFAENREELANSKWNNLSFGQKFKASYARGMDNMARSIGGYMKMNQLDDVDNEVSRYVSNYLERKSQERLDIMEETLGTSPDLGEFKWSHWANSDYRIETVASTIPFILAAIPVGVVAAEIVAATGGAALLTTAGTLNTVGTITTAIGAAYAGRNFEGMVEAGGAYQEDIANGKSIDEAVERAKKIHSDGMNLMTLDAMELMLMFAKFKGPKRIPKLITNTGRVAGTALVEGFEELSQGFITSEEYEGINGFKMYATTPEGQENTAAGMVIGTGMGVGARGLSAAQEIPSNLRVRKAVATLMSQESLDVVEKNLSGAANVAGINLTPEMILDKRADKIAQTVQQLVKDEKISAAEGAKVLEQIATELNLKKNNVLDKYSTEWQKQAARNVYSDMQELDTEEKDLNKKRDEVNAEQVDARIKEIHLEKKELRNKFESIAGNINDTKFMVDGILFSREEFREYLSSETNLNNIKKKLIKVEVIKGDKLEGEEYASRGNEIESIIKGLKSGSVNVRDAAVMLDIYTENAQDNAARLAGIDGISEHINSNFGDKFIIKTFNNSTEFQAAVDEMGSDSDKGSDLNGVQGLALGKTDETGRRVLLINKSNSNANTVFHEVLHPQIEKIVGAVGAAAFNSSVQEFLDNNPNDTSEFTKWAETAYGTATHKDGVIVSLDEALVEYTAHMTSVKSKELLKKYSTFSGKLVKWLNNFRGNNSDVFNELQYSESEGVFEFLEASSSSLALASVLEGKLKSKEGSNGAEVLGDSKSSKIADTTNIDTFTQELEQALEGTGTFAHMTAENPQNKIQSDEQNKADNIILKDRLIELGYNPIEIKGYYDRDENSFYVKGMTLEHAYQLGEEFKQESVAHSVGMIYTANENQGMMEPITGELFVNQGMENHYSVVETKEEGDFRYSVDYDWSNFVKIPIDLSGVGHVKASKVVDIATTPEAIYDYFEITPESQAEWRGEHTTTKYPQNSKVSKAAENYYNGKITQEKYLEIVKRENPIIPFESVPDMPTQKEIALALTSNKLKNKGILGLNANIPDGHRVENRLDIPSYLSYQVWTVTVHNGSISALNGQKKHQAIGYGQTATITNVEFKSNPKQAYRVATGSANKSPFAVMAGDHVNESPESAHLRATKAMKSEEWVQVGMNPYRHSWFYDKANSKPVISAKEVIQVGALVLARGVQYANPSSSEFGFTNKDSGKEIKFSAIGMNANLSPKQLADLEKAIEYESEIESQITFTPEGAIDNLGSEIKRITGWEINGDGLWRYEIDAPTLKNDVIDKIIPRIGREKDENKNLDYFATTTLDNLIESDIFNLYPDFKGNIEVRFVVNNAILGPSAAGGVLNKKEDGKHIMYLKAETLFYTEREALRGLITHELQHIIQEVEGFAQGASSSYTKEEAANTYDTLNRNVQYSKDILNSTRNLVEHYNSPTPNLIKRQKEYTDAVTSLNQFKMAATDENGELLSGWELYQRRAGEVEARNVANRMDMTADEKRNNLMRYTEEYDRDMQLYKFKNNPHTRGAILSSEQLTASRIQQENMPINVDTKFSKLPFFNESIDIMSQGNGSYKMINEQGQFIGSMELSASNFGSGYISVSVAKIKDESYREGGLGTALYMHVAQEEYSQRGRVLTSSEFRNEASDGLWNKLERMGVAEVMDVSAKTGRDIYSYIPEEQRESKASKLNWKVRYGSNLKGDDLAAKLMMNKLEREAHQDYKERKEKLDAELEIKIEKYNEVKDLPMKFEIDADRIHGETASGKAFKVSRHRYDERKYNFEYLPKSQTTITTDNGISTITIPRWLFESKMGKNFMEFIEYTGFNPISGFQNRDFRTTGYDESIVYNGNKPKKLNEDVDAVLRSTKQSRIPASVDFDSTEINGFGKAIGLSNIKLNTFPKASKLGKVIIHGREFKYFDLSELNGKQVMIVPGDMMGTHVYKGFREGSEINYQMNGGPAFGAMHKHAIWAADSKGTMESIVNMIQTTREGYVVIVAGGPVQHRSNFEFSKLYIMELEESIARGEITREEAILKTSAAIEKIKAKTNNKGELVYPKIENVSINSIDELLKFLTDSNSTFDVRREFMDGMGAQRKTMKGIEGFPNIPKMLALTIDNKIPKSPNKNDYGMPIISKGEILAVGQVDINNPVGAQIHPGYEFTLNGNFLGPVQSGISGYNIVDMVHTKGNPKGIIIEGRLKHTSGSGNKLKVLETPNYIPASQQYAGHLKGNHIATIGKQRAKASRLYLPAIEIKQVVGNSETNWFDGAVTGSKFWLKGNLTANGHMTDATKKRHNQHNQSIKAKLLKVKNNVDKLSEAVKKSYPKGVPTEVVREINNALGGEFTVLRLPSRIVNAINKMRENVDGMTKELLDTGLIQGDLEIKMNAQLGVYINRTYEVFTNPNYTVPIDVFNHGVAMIRKTHLEEFGVEITEEEATMQLNLVISKMQHTAPGAFIEAREIIKRDIKSLKKRKEIPEWMREVMGETKDPVKNYYNSMFKLINLVEQTKFLSDLREMGMGDYFSETQTGEHNYALHLGGGSVSDQYFPLHQGKKLFTTKEFAEVLNTFTSKVESEGRIYKTLMVLNYMFKYGATILSVQTHVRNFMSNIFVTMGMGVNSLNPNNWAKVKNNLMFNGKIKQDELIRLTELGILGDGAMSGEMGDVINDMFNDEGASSIIGLTDSLVKKAWKKVKGVAEKAYQIEDDFWKAMAYYNMKEIYTEAYAKELKDGTMTMNDVEEMAALDVVSHMPTYSKVPEVIKSIRKTPIIGSFPSFTAEIIRTSINHVINTPKLIKSDNKVLKKLGIQKAVGMMTAMSTIPVVSFLAKEFISEMGDDEKEALQAEVPSWSTFSSLFVYNNENGVVSYLDLSYMNPYAYWHKSTSSFVNMVNKGDKDAMGKFLKETFSPFLGVEAVTNAIMECVANKDGLGREIYNSEDDLSTKAMNTAKYVAKIITPGTIKSLMKISDPDKNQWNEFIAMFSGARISSLNTEDNYTYGLMATTQRINSIKYLYTKIAYNEKASITEMDKKLKEANKKLNKLFAENWQSGENLHLLGLDENREGRILAQKTSFLSPSERWGLVIGKSFPIKPQHRNINNEELDYILDLVIELVVDSGMPGKDGKRILTSYFNNDKVNTIMRIIGEDDWLLRAEIKALVKKKIR